MNSKRRTCSDYDNWHSVVTERAAGDTAGDKGKWEYSIRTWLWQMLESICISWQSKRCLRIRDKEVWEANLGAGSFQCTVVSTDGEELKMDSLTCVICIIEENGHGKWDTTYIFHSCVRKWTKPTVILHSLSLDSQTKFRTKEGHCDYTSVG